MITKEKFELKEGRGSLWFVEEEDRGEFEDTRFNGQINLDGMLYWMTVYKNHGGPKAPMFNLVIGARVQVKKSKAKAKAKTRTAAKPATKKVPKYLR